MRLTLIQPPIEDFYFTPHRASALGMRAAAAYLESRGHQVREINFPVAGSPSRIPVPSHLSHLKPFILENETGPLSFFTSFKRFGPDTEYCVEMIMETKPDAVLLSVMAFCYGKTALDLAAAVKQKSGAPIIAGGPGVSVYPAYYLDAGPVDYVYCGEAERDLADLIDQAGKAGISPKGTAAAARLRSMDDSTVPEQNIEFPLRITGRTNNRVFAAAAATRGCEKNCSFCSVRLHHGRGLRKTPLIKIEAALAGLKKIIGTGTALSLNFEDDNLFTDPEYAFSVIDCCKSTFPNVSFTAENGLDYLCLDEQIVRRMIESGFFRFNLSLGSLESETLPDLNRPGSAGKLEHIVKIVKQSGIIPAVFFICGLPSDTPGKIVKTLLFLNRLRVKTGISLFYPVPGLPPLETEADIDRFASFHPQQTAGSSAFPWNGSLTVSELITAFRLARFNNLLISDNNKEAAEIAMRWCREETLYSQRKENGILLQVPIPNLASHMLTSYFKQVIQQ